MFFNNLMILSGTIVLMASLFPVRRLIQYLPKSSLRTYWYSLITLIFMFIIGYTAYGIYFWARPAEDDLHIWIIPSIFFFGAVFVWLTSTLSLRTTQDLRRMALLEVENITDSLIGIYNRRYLDRRLINEVARAKRYDLPLSVLMIDIDHFKEVNDIHGHQAGDLALSYLGKLILGVIRQTDIAARYGGEEIVIITPDTPAATAADLAERLRQSIETHKLVLTNEAAERKTIHITVSIGVAGLSDTIDEADELIAFADQAMYQAKQRGRNRVLLYKGE